MQKIEPPRLARSARAIRAKRALRTETARLALGMLSLSKKFHNFDSPFDAFFWLGSCAAKSPRKAPLEEVADFLVFDTETSGLSAKAVAVQVAIGFFSADGRALGFYDKLWKLPRGVRISKSSMKIHGISNARVFQEGLDARCELPKVHAIFKKMKARGKKIIAHNAAFDVRMMAQTASAHGFAKWNLQRTDTFCTMQASAPRCGLTSKKTGRLRKPRNAELYRFLLGREPTGALHDAQVDVTVTARSYVAGRERRWWR